MPPPARKAEPADAATAPDTSAEKADMSDGGFPLEHRSNGVPWQPPAIGRAVADFEPRPPSGAVYRPDTVFDGWSTWQLTVRLASVRGYSHRFDGRPREDDLAVAVHESSGTFVFAVADGVSAAEQPHIGATLACRTAVDDLLVQLDSGEAVVDWRRVVSAAAWQLVMRVTRGAQPAEADRREAERLLATTLVTGTVVPLPDGSLLASVVQVGDSSAWTLRRGHFDCLFPPHVAAAEEPDSCAVTPLPRIPSETKPVVVEVPSGGALLVGTDGFGDALGDGGGPVGELFGRVLREPPPAAVLGHLLDFSRETFDDDRTLLAVWAREPGRPSRPSATRKDEG